MALVRAARVCSARFREEPLGTLAGVSCLVAVATCFLFEGRRCVATFYGPLWEVLAACERWEASGMVQ